MLELLHTTHTETYSMKRLPLGKFFWRKMSKDIEEVYKTCQECKEESNDKVQKTAKVMMAPAESHSMDYATYEGRDLASGFVEVTKTRSPTLCL